jgi:hypothetical protein
MSTIIEIRDAVAEKYKQDITGHARHAEINMVRKAFANALRPYYTLKQIGDSLGKDYSTVIHYTRNHHEDLKLEVYKSAYLYTKALYNEKTKELLPTEDIQAMIQDIRQRLLKLDRVLSEHVAKL